MQTDSVVIATIAHGTSIQRAARIASDGLNSESAIHLFSGALRIKSKMVYFPSVRKRVMRPFFSLPGSPDAPAGFRG
jgi:hypothetical protein